MARVLIARPRLDCSFKIGTVPDIEGPPSNGVLALFGRFIDGLETYFSGHGWEVTSDKRPLWQFELADMQRAAQSYDLVFFPHKLARQFPIGQNALFYKTTAIPEFLTVDPQGWGASLSFLPVKPAPATGALAFYQRLQERIRENSSVFQQPVQVPVPCDDGYLLFICQLPHDETIQFHSTVTVEQALAVVVAYAEKKQQRLLVKGHPANRKAMVRFREMAEASDTAQWIEDASIHTCLAGASRVFMVNSGVGFEAMLHGKTVVHFGDAEYSNVHLRCEPSVEAIGALENQSVSQEEMASFLYQFFQKTIRYDDMESYHTVLGKYVGA
ncbi:capsular polysaccharide export protein, LipB/KpsS family [Rhizobium sp. Leaf341]|uniref:capsular polysaccharide export protein, LipB/KpsS family n=1 Tax=Rhizobium sp. Leaf341 TaxID=1736344 RepID=UPI000712C73B|nr:hypothetical protein [Rhizobium sp. Leaf341]KQR77642.1 hypothetical protein ASG03_14675 [Rhizobium sp. Leaf341]